MVIGADSYHYEWTAEELNDERCEECGCLPTDSCTCYDEKGNDDE